MLAAAMRHHRFFFVIEFSRNHPEIVSALPHPVFVSPYPKFQYATWRPSRGRHRERGCYRGLGMIQLVAFCRPLRLVALALCSATIAVSATPASARSHHGSGRHARTYHASHHAGWHHHHYRHYRHVARYSRYVVRDTRYVARDSQYVARDS